MKNLNGLMLKLKELEDHDVDINTPYQKCSSCDRINETVNLCIEPFADDIHNQQNWVFLCKACYIQHCEDI